MREIRNKRLADSIQLGGESGMPTYGNTGGILQDYRELRDRI
jgi:hypothetical protein